VGDGPTKGHRDLTVEAVGCSMVYDTDVHRWGTIEMRDRFGVEKLPDPTGVHAPQAHVAPGDGRDRPRETPAVAVEHREGPQVHAAVAEARLDHLAESVQICPAVGVDHSLRSAGGPRRVVDRDGLLLVFEPALDRVRRTGGEEILVGVSGGTRIIHAHYLDPGGVHSSYDGLELAVHEEKPGSGVGQDVGDLLRPQPSVDGGQDAAGGWDGEVCLEQGWNIGAQKCNPVMLFESRLPQRPSESIYSFLEYPIRIAAFPMDHRGLVGKDVGAPPQERDGRQLASIDPRVHLSSPCSGTLMIVIHVTGPFQIGATERPWAHLQAEAALAAPDPLPQRRGRSRGQCYKR